MNKVSNIHHIGLLSLAAAVFLVSIGTYFYMNHAVVIMTNKAVLAKNILTLEEADKSHGQDIMAVFNDTVADRDRLRKLFIPSSEVVTFIEAIESTGRSSGIRSASTSVSISSISADKKHFNAKVEAKGSWSDVMQALMSAETLPYDVSIDNVLLGNSGDPGQGGSSGWRLSYDVSVSIMASSTPS